MSWRDDLERDLHAVRDRSALSAVFTSLCERLAADLQRHGYAGRTVAIKLALRNFRSVTRARTLDFHTADRGGIRRLRAVPEARTARSPPAAALGCGWGARHGRGGARARGGSADSLELF